jgi:pimeloyl-ACP methyl ester carboxylesterase
MRVRAALRCRSHTLVRATSLHYNQCMLRLLISALLILWCYSTLAVPRALADAAPFEGGKVHYTRQGSGPTAVVLVHGWTCDSSFWNQNIEALARHALVLAVDLPGHGRSDPAADYSMPSFARAVEAVMTHARVRRATLVGHSMGGAVMLAFARAYPQRVQSLVAVDSFFIDSAIASRMRGIAAQFRGDQGRAAREKMIRSMFSEATTEELQQRILRVMLSTSPEVAVKAMEQIWDPEFWEPDVIRKPLLAILSPTNPMKEEVLRQRFPLAEMAVVRNAGHFLMMEKPEEFNTVLLEWLFRAGRQSGGARQDQGQ